MKKNILSTNTNIYVKRTVICIILITLSIFKLSAQTGTIQTRIQQVENNLIPYVPVKGFKGWNLLDRMKYYGVPGVSIAVIRNYKIEWAKAFGWADTVKKIPMTTRTMLSAGSISKFLMAATALNLVEKGKLSLDQPINQYLQSWKIEENDYTRKTPITLRMLLSHTAGTSQTSYFGFLPSKNPLPSIVQILNGEKIAETRKVVVNSETGKEFRYSGGGSMIAQMALMDVTHQSFDELTQQVLFTPLKMNNSTFTQPLPKKFVPQASAAYSYASWYKGEAYVYPQQAAAGLYSTPTDLATFFIEIQKAYLGKSKLLSKETTRQMLSPQITVSKGGYLEEVGIGPFLLQRIDNKENKGRYFEFTGVNAGFLAYAIGSVEGGNGVIIMLNSGDDQNGLGKEIRRAVAKVYNWYQFLPEEVKPIKLVASELAKLEGRYRLGPNEVLYLRKENDYLVENINQGRDIYCFPIAKDTLVFTDFNVKGFFKFDEKGNAVSIQSEWQQQASPKMKDSEFTANELVAQGKYAEAKLAFKDLHLNEYQLTYFGYDYLNTKPAKLEAAKMILELAQESFPSSSIIYSRWGDYYLKTNDKKAALTNYQRALELDPSSEELMEIIKKLN